MKAKLARRVKILRYRLNHRRRRADVVDGRLGEDYTVCSTQCQHFEARTWILTFGWIQSSFQQVQKTHCI